jgi:hypothetical protein
MLWFPSREQILVAFGFAIPGIGRNVTKTEEPHTHVVDFLIGILEPCLPADPMQVFECSGREGWNHFLNLPE